MQDEIRPVFVSYARANSEFALRLANDLRAAGMAVWLDQADIPAGVRWDTAVENALADSSSVLLILSPDSVRSHTVLDEVSFALEHQKRIVPVLYDICDVPFRIKRLQYINFVGRYPQALMELRSALASGGSRGEPTRRIGWDAAGNIDQVGSSRFEVLGDRGWQDTGIRLWNGDLVRISYVSGAFRNPYTGEPVKPHEVDSDDHEPDEGGCRYVTTRTKPMLALIAKIGEIMFTGDTFKDDLRGEGHLFLRSNNCDCDRHREYFGGTVLLNVHFERSVD